MYSTSPSGQAQGLPLPPNSAKIPATDYLTGAETADSYGVTVVVPAYNEEEGIGLVVGELCALRGRIDAAVEVVVVDDGSQDQTAQVAESHDGVIVLCHRGNRGYGEALKTRICREG